MGFPPLPVLHSLRSKMPRCKEGQGFEPRRNPCTLRLIFAVLTPQMGIFQRKLYLLCAVETGQGESTAHTGDYLPLLPSGPGGVCKPMLRRSRPHAQLRTGDKKMAERVGFEPTVPLPVQVLSRHAPSTGLGYLSGKSIIYCNSSCNFRRNRVQGQGLSY